MVFSWSFISKWPEIDGLLNNREFREKETTSINAKYMFNKFRTLGIVLRFCLIEKSQSLTSEKFWTKIFLHYRRRRLPLTTLLQVFIALSFYSTARGQLSSRSLPMQLVFLYLLHTLSHSQGFKGDCEAKITFPAISWELDIYQVKASLLGGVQKLLYCWLSLFFVLSRDICFFPANNYNTIQYQLRAFSPLAFLCKSCSLDWSFSFRLVQSGFWDLDFCNVLSFPFFFCFWKFSSHCRH